MRRDGMTMEGADATQGAAGHDGDTAAGTLTPRQRRFIEEYMVDLNGTQAAIRAGYAPGGARQHASRLLAQAPVQAALAQAMSERRKRTELTADRRAPYNRTGTAHVLAVSGLHVGMVFLYANALLCWLTLLHRGHLLRNLLAILLIWLFAVTAGLSPGTVRAAMMFTALQLALATTSNYTSVNVLAAAAFCMLLWRPSYLFHLGFQMSFLSVAAILLWGLPLYRRLRTRWRLLNGALGMILVGLVASIATTPLVSHAFGTIPLAGIVANPPVILLAYGVVGVSLLWVVIPWPPLGIVIRPLLETLLSLQNGVVSAFAALPFAAIQYRMTTAQMIVVYLFFAIFTLIVWHPWRKKR